MSTVQPWEQQPGEPNLWFSRFDIFRAKGPKRSVLSVYNAEREQAGKGGDAVRTPGAWDNAVAKWNWRVRAEAWDAHERARRAEEEEADRIAERERRLTQLRASRQLADRRLQELLKDPASTANLTAPQLVQMMIAIQQQQRIEYGENVNRVELSGPDKGPVQHEMAGIDWSKVSPETARLVLEAQDALAREQGETDGAGGR